MGYPTNIDGSVTATPANLESLLASLCGVRQRLWEQQNRQGRALELLGFRQPTPSDGAKMNGVPPASFNDAISVLAREVNFLGQTCDEMTTYAEALEGQYSEKSSL